MGEADWLDSADKVASVVGALAGVAALVITVRDKNLRTATPRDSAAALPTLTPVPEPQPTTPVPPGGSTPLPPPAPTPLPPSVRPAGGPSAWDFYLDSLGPALAISAVSTLLGTWLLSWIGHGSIGSWWLLAGLVVSFAVGLFFKGTDPRKSAGVLLLYGIWVPIAAWLGARGFVYYWFPHLAGSPGTRFTVLFIVGNVFGVIAGFVRRRR
jgi:hypothetical protein